MNESSENLTEKEKLETLRELIDQGDQSDDSDLTLDQLCVRLDNRANSNDW